MPSFIPRPIITKRLTIRIWICSFRSILVVIWLLIFIIIWILIIHSIFIVVMLFILILRVIFIVIVTLLEVVCVSSYGLFTGAEMLARKYELTSDEWYDWYLSENTFTCGTWAPFMHPLLEGGAQSGDHDHQRVEIPSWRPWETCAIGVPETPTPPTTTEPAWTAPTQRSLEIETNKLYKRLQYRAFNG